MIYFSKLLKTFFEYAIWGVAGVLVWQTTGHYNARFLNDIMLTLLFKIDIEQRLLGNIITFTWYHIESIVAFALISVLLSTFTVSTKWKYLIYYIMYSSGPIAFFILVYVGRYEISTSSPASHLIDSTYHYLLLVIFFTGLAGCFVGDLIRQKIKLQKDRV